MIIKNFKNIVSFVLESRNNKPSDNVKKITRDLLYMISDTFENLGDSLTEEKIIDYGDWCVIKKDRRRESLVNKK